MRLPCAESPSDAQHPIPHSTLRTPHSTGLLELNEILLKACARDVRERYQSAEEMHADLEVLHRGESVRAQRSTRRRITNGLKSSSAIFLGKPHWCNLSSGPTTITERPE